MTNQILHVHLSWEDPTSGDIFSHLSSLPVTIGRSHQNAISLNSSVISRQHARLVQSDNAVYIEDLDSGNGTWVNGEYVKRSQLETGDTFQIGPFYFEVGFELRAETSAAEDGESTIAGGTIQLDRSQLAGALAEEAKGTVVLVRSQIPGLRETGEETRASAEAHETEAAPAPQPTAFPPADFLKSRQISMAQLNEFGLPVEETTYLTLGGGMGSFVWVNYLRLGGVPAKNITAIGVEEKPYGRYRRLCQNSQIPEHERLRSDSGATIDNIWGWPGYATREIWGCLKRGNLPEALRISWQIFVEPSLYEAYTPRSGDVYASMEREMARINWDQIWRYGRIRAIRQTDDGRYVVAYSQTGQQSGRKHRFIVAPYLHLAIGYPGVRFLPDLQAYREQTGDFRTVVNAYEEHEQVYDHLAAHGGTVVLRGRGIVSSRILQRLYEVRQASGADINILHLMRSPNTHGTKYGRATRFVEHHWEYQPYNWPKASFSGELRAKQEQADDEGRDQILNDLGGVTTANRSDWRHIVASGLVDGWYQIRFGHVDKVLRRASGKLTLLVTGRTAVQEQTELQADFIIDATGLNATIEHHPLLKDLLDVYDLPRNPKGNLAVSNYFELPQMQNGNGRLYASGAMTLGGPHAAVDSFIGLNFAAQHAIESLVQHRAPGLRRVSGWRSLWQWVRWARGATP